MLSGPCDLWCEQNLRPITLPLCYVLENTVYLDVNVRMGWCINDHQKVSYITARIGAIYGHAMEMRTKWQHSGNVGYGGVTNGTLRSKNQLLQQQPHAHRVARF